MAAWEKRREERRCPRIIRCQMSDEKLSDVQALEEEMSKKIKICKVCVQSFLGAKYSNIVLRTDNPLL